MEKESGFIRGAITIMGWAERAVVLLVGFSLFVVASAIIVHSLMLLPALFTSSGAALLPGVTTTLNDVLLVLMLIELAYTVMLSLRGSMLAIEPFLIVGVIATVRRILVITIGEGTTGLSHVNELFVLTFVLLAFVASIFVLNLRSRARAKFVHPGANRSAKFTAGRARQET